MEDLGTVQVRERVQTCKTEHTPGADASIQI